MGNARDYVAEFLGNRILLIALVSMFTAQLLKVILVLMTTRRLDLPRFFSTGGMPSSHTAMVVGLSAATGRIAGMHSPYFALSVVLALVVMNDASGIRRAAGEQAKVLNYMIRNWDSAQTPELFVKQLRELLGHKPIEVLAGAVIGLGYGLWL
jgi:hypothetical protein